MAGEQKTVIVAEDEILTRMLAADVLAEAGYNVIQAAHAEEALAFLKDHVGDVQLLFTDIHMPGSITGLDLAHIVRSHWPEIAIIITSGEHMPKANEMPAKGVFVAKPYKLNDVVTQIGTMTTSE